MAEKLRPDGEVQQLREVALREQAQQFQNVDRRRDHAYRLRVLALSGVICVGVLVYLGWAFRSDPKGFVASLGEVVKDLALLGAGWAGGSAATRPKPLRK